MEWIPEGTRLLNLIYVMSKTETTPLEYIFQETKIHFLLGNEENVMVNATEMAKLFGKRTDVFLKTDNVKAFIAIANLPPNSGRIIENRGRNGVYFERKLALKFAAWLDVEFEFWVFEKIDEILFGKYKIVDQKLKERAEKENRINEIKENLRTNSDFKLLEQLEFEVRQSKNGISKELINQLNLFKN